MQERDREDRDREDRAIILQLVKEFQEIVQYYRLTLPQPFIQLTDTSTQYGSWQPYLRTLTLSRQLIEKYSWDVVLEIFKHELAHLYLSENGSDRDGEAHGPAFQEACRRLGVAPWARSATVEVDPDTARSQHRHWTEEKERQLRRVEKLFSLAQSTNSNEAALAMQRARELMQQYQIDRQSEQRNYTYLLINHQKKTMPAHQSAIASILCTHFYVDCVSRSQYDARTHDQYKVLEVLGSIENVQIAEYVYWFLWRELPQLWRIYSQQKTPAKRRSTQRSFYLGVLNGFHEKLSREKAGQDSPLKTPEESVATEALTTIDKSLDRQLKQELKSFVQERFPRLNRGGKSRSGVESEAYRSGVERGQTLELRQGIQKNTQQLAITGRNT